MTDFKEQVVSLIEKTADPLAAIKVQEAYSAVDRVGRMLAGLCDKDTVMGYTSNLTMFWPDEKIEQVCNKPEFVMALAGLFCQSLKEWKDNLSN